jgi:hypothetical protein
MCGEPVGLLVILHLKLVIFFRRTAELSVKRFSFARLLLKP